jgi:uncharacterized membrane protein
MAGSSFEVVSYLKLSGSSLSSLPSVGGHASCIRTPSQRATLLRSGFRLLPRQPARRPLARGIDGVLEIIGGLIVLWITPRAVNYVVAAITEHELSEDPRDPIATHLLSASHGLAHAGKTLAAFYLLSHGVTKVALVVALLCNKLWAYPSMIALLTLFIAYQLYRTSYTHSLA